MDRLQDSLESRGLSSLWTTSAHELRVEQARILARVLLELPDEVPTGRIYRGCNGGSKANLRGLPAIGEKSGGRHPWHEP